MKCFLISLGFFCVSCAPPGGQGFLDTFEPIEEETSKEILFYEDNRDGSENFVETFRSDKLDLVFVVDSQSGMEKVFVKRIFGDDFLKRFSDYDWRLAYTNAGVNSSLFEDKNTKKRKSNCNPGFGTFNAVLGLGTSSALFAYHAIDNFKGCFKRNQKMKGASGQNLKFKHQGKILDKNILQKSDSNYQEIFDNTFQDIPVKKSWSHAQKGKGAFGKLSKSKYFFGDKSTKQEGDSFPGYSLLLSVFDHNTEFIRSDSQVVYVVITTQDSKISVTAEGLRDSFEKEYENGDRFRIISIVLKEKNSQACETSLRQFEIPNIISARSLIGISEDMDATVIDICSQSIDEQLFHGIQKYLHPTISL